MLLVLVGGLVGGGIKVLNNMDIFLIIFLGLEVGWVLHM